MYIIFLYVVHGKRQEQHCDTLMIYWFPRMIKICNSHLKGAIKAQPWEDVHLSKIDDNRLYDGHVKACDGKETSRAKINVNIIPD